MVLTISQFCQTWWKDVYKKVKKSVVFIDDAASECLHWSGGLIDLYDAGAIAVKEFSSFESGESAQKKGVFITGGINNNLNILKNIIENSKFEYCVLLTNVHPSVLQSERSTSSITSSDNDMQAYIQLENDMLIWMGNMNYTVEIFYMPLFIIPITSSLFLTPSFHSLFPTISIPSHVNEPPFHALPKDMQITLRHLVTSLHSLFNTLDIKEDIYSLGEFSAIVAGLLEHFPAAVSRRKSASNSCTLILVDRSLDVCSATSFNSDSLLDRIISVLPHFPGHNTDVAVNMSSICNANVDSVIEDLALAPGCLAHNYDLVSKDILQALIENRQKDVLTQLHTSLSQIKHGGAFKSPARITPLSIEKLITEFSGDYAEIEKNSALLQQSLAVVQALKSPKMPQIELLMSLEKLVLQNMATSRDSTSILSQLSQMIKNHKTRGLNLENLLCLLLHIYSLAGTDIKFSLAHENQVEIALANALYEDRAAKSSVLTTIVFETSTLKECTEAARSIITKLKSVGNARQTLLKYKSVLRNENPQQPYEYRGVLQQLTEDLLKPSRPELVDLASKSSGIKDLLKSSLSLLLNKSKHQVHPLDNPQVIIFVIGGVTANESRQIQDIVRRSKTDVEILVGSTKLVHPIDTMQAVLLNA